MRIANLASLAVLVTAAAAGKCRHSSKSPVISSSAVPSSLASSSSAPSSVISSSLTVSSSVVPSSVISSSSIVSSSAVPSSSTPSSVISSSLVFPSSAVLSSSTPVSSSAVPSSTLEPACGGKCYAAITAEPAVGEAFCSSFLALEPETTTVTEVASVTSTRTSLATVTTLLTLTTATTTKVSGATTLFLKRQGDDPTPVRQDDTPSESIMSVCSYASERVSSACGCYVSTTATVTITETTTFTEIPEVTSTLVETTTTGVVRTIEAMATTTIPAQPILNSGLEDYLRTGTISPWSIANPNGGRIEVVNGVNPCTTGGAMCAGGSVVVRAFPPTSGGGYVALRQTFAAKRSTQYQFSFMFRCLNFDTGSRMVIVYQGVVVGTVNCPNINTSAFQYAQGMFFTTDGTGVGTLEVRFQNPTNLPYLYIYGDRFQATVA